MLPNHSNGLQQLMVLHTLRHFQAQNTNKHNITKELFQSPATSCKCNSQQTDEIQAVIKNTQAGVITMQETKLNQFHKTPNIPQFTPIKTDRTYKQGGGLLT